MSCEHERWDTSGIEWNSSPGFGLCASCGERISLRGYCKECGRKEALELGPVDYSPALSMEEQAAHQGRMFRDICKFCGHAQGRTVIQ